MDARVIRDCLAHDLRIGQIVSAPDALIASLAESGAVDPHPDAVAYAQDQGAEVVSIGASESDDPPKARRGRPPKLTQAID